MAYDKWPLVVEAAMMTVLEYLVALDPETESPEGKLLNAMADYREPYEKRHYPIGILLKEPKPNPPSS